VVRSPLQGEPASPLRPPSGCPFHPRCDIALDSCASAEVPLIELGRRKVACVRANEDAPGASPEMEVAVAGPH
jgi:oligopeptide/dipeptide ABC transporter ATP-binding protein